MRFLPILIWRLILLPDMVSLGFGFRLIIIVLRKRLQILFTDGTLPTIRGRDCFIDWKSQELVVQIPPFIDWTCSAVHAGVECHATAEMTLRSSVQWCRSHQWAITCGIGIQLFCVQWCSNVAKVRTASERCNIFTQFFCNECNPIITIANQLTVPRHRQTIPPHLPPPAAAALPPAAPTRPRKVAGHDLDWRWWGPGDCCSASRGSSPWRRDLMMLRPAAQTKTTIGGGDSSVVRAPDSWSKGRRFESLLERWENVLLLGQLSVLTLISASIPPPCYRSST